MDDVIVIEDESEHARSSSAVTGGGRQSSQDIAWSCHECTLLNTPSSAVCGVCSAPRGDQSFMLAPHGDLAEFRIFTEMTQSLGWSNGRLYPKEGEDTSSFLQRAKPSTTRPEQCCWIQVHAPAREGAANSEECRKSWELGKDECKEIARKVEADKEAGRSKRGASQAATREILQTTKRHGSNMGGKWLLFVPTRHADQVWSAIATATVEGTLGISAKITPTEHDDKDHCICVYTQAWWDDADNFRVLDRLAVLNVFPRALVRGWKPDIFTDAGIYGKKGGGRGGSDKDASGVKWDMMLYRKQAQEAMQACTTRAPAQSSKRELDTAAARAGEAAAACAAGEAGSGTLSSASLSSASLPSASHPESEPARGQSATPVTVSRKAKRPKIVPLDDSD